jgi:hypothetical protein
VGEKESERERERENIYMYVYTWQTKILDKQAHTRPTQFTRLLDFSSSYSIGVSERH